MSEVKFDEIVVLPCAYYEGQAKIEFASGVFQNDNADAEYMCSSGYMPKRYQHLISAAPDLYEALNVCLGHLTGGMDGDWRDCDYLNLARTALSKARGEL